MANTTTRVFIADGFTDLHVWVPQKDLETLKAVGKNTIVFRRTSLPGAEKLSCSYATSDPKIIAFLRKQNKAGHVTLREDALQQELECPYCDKTFNNTNAGQTAQAKHIATDHTDDDGELIPATVTKAA